MLAIAPLKNEALLDVPEDMYLRTISSIRLWVSLCISGRRARTSRDSFVPLSADCSIRPGGDDAGRYPEIRALRATHWNGNMALTLLLSAILQETLSIMHTGI